MCATTKDKVESIGKENNVPGAYVNTNYDDMLKIPALDAVVVASPSMSHVDLTLRALQAGKHVLVEKPFAPNAAESEKMRAAAAKSDRTTMIAEAYRFASSHAYAKELINQGYIGNLKMLNITLFQGPTERPEPAQPRLHWRSNNATGGGFSQGPASTFFDSVIDWFGAVKSVRGTVYAQFPGGKQPDGTVADSDDALTAHFVMENGGWGTFTVAGGIPFGRGATWDIMGTEGSLRVSQVGLLPIGTDTVSGGRFDPNSNSSRSPTACARRSPRQVPRLSPTTPTRPWCASSPKASKMAPHRRQTLRTPTSYSASPMPSKSPAWLGAGSRFSPSRSKRKAEVRLEFGQSPATELRAD